MAAILDRGFGTGSRPYKIQIFVSNEIALVAIVAFGFFVSGCLLFREIIRPVATTQVSVGNLVFSWVIFIDAKYLNQR